MSRRLTFVLVGLSGLVLLLVAAALTIPLLFRDRLQALIDTRLRAAIDADVTWTAIDLSIVRGFPHLGVTVRQLRVCNRAPFDGLCLAEIDEVTARVALLGLLRQTLDVRSLRVQRPIVRLEAREDGIANWQVHGADAAAPAGSSPSAMRLALREYWVEDAHVRYADRVSGLEWELVGLDHGGDGDVSAAAITFDTATHADGASLRQGGVSYLRDARVDVDAAVVIDRLAERLTLRDTEVLVNELTLALDGSIARDGENLALDLDWTSRADDLRGLASLLPARLVGSLEGLETAGAVELAGRVRGLYGERAVPALDLRLAVRDGRFKYASLPAGADQIAIDGTITSAQAADWDQVVVDVPRFTARLAGRPVEGRFRLASLVSDPSMDVAVRTSLDLSDLPRLVPFAAGDTLAGHAEADVRLAGRVSALRQEQYQRFTAEGYVDLRDVLYRRRASNRDVHASALSLTFNPRHVQLLADGAGIGETTVTIRGRLERYLTWWFADDVLSGAVDVNGAAIDLADLLRRDAPAANPAADTGLPRLATLPERMDLTITTAARRVSYGAIELGGVRGQIRVHDRRADLSDVGFGLFGGSVVVTGSYDTKDLARPLVALSYSAKGIDIQQAARQSSALRAIAPVVLAAAGTVDSTLEMTGALSPSLTFDLASLAGRGSVNSSNVRLDRFTPLVALARSLKIGHLETATIGDVRFTFVVHDGRMITSPFDVQIGELSLRVGGSTTFAGPMLDYDITGRIPTSVFGAEASDRVAEWLGPAAAGGGVPALLGVTARLTGTVGQPSVALKVDAGGAASAVRGAALEQARAEAERLLARARNEAESIRREADAAAARLRAEADEAADRLVAGAYNPLAQAGARVAAARLRQEAATRADQIVQTASGRADAVLEDARRAAADEVEAAAPR
jgi:uncharacterized protein involved in outer membrane biogenesis